MAGRTGRKPYDTAIGKAPQFKEEINTLRAEFIEIILQYLSGSTEKDDFYEMIAICLETRGSTSKVRKARARKSIEEYSEAAMMDGCSHFSVFFKIMLPLARSGLVTISIFNFLWTWNDYLYAMTFLPSANKRTLPVGMVMLQSTAMYKTDWGALFAGLVIIMIPSVIIYAFFNKQLQSGLNAGGIKG